MGKILFFFWAMPLAFSAPALDWKGSQYQVMRRYLKLHKKFFQKLCQKGDHTYGKLNLKFRGTGFFIPHLGEIELIVKRLRTILSSLKKKCNGLKQNGRKLSTRKILKGQEKA